MGGDHMPNICVFHFDVLAVSVEQLYATCSASRHGGHGAARLQGNSYDYSAILPRTSPL